MNNPTVSYAQNKEDLLIAALLKGVKKGFYLDIGASHPEHLSVTKYFYERGWHGINIEPNPKMHKLLERDRPRDLNIRVGLSDKRGKLMMRQYLGWRSGLSTFSEEIKAENLGIEEYVDVETEVVTLKDILDEYKVTKIDFMKVDVEGYEYQVLLGNDWATYRPTLICIEANHMVDDWESLLKSNNYKEVFFDGLNKYYLSEESVTEHLKNFSYANDILDLNYINVGWYNELKELERKNEQLSADVSAFKTQNLRLQREIIEQKRIVSLMKQLAKSSDAVIRHRIEKLNKKTATRPKNNHKAQISIFSSKEDKAQLYMNIRLNDLENYFTETYKKEPIHYRLLAVSYDKSSKLLFRLGKGSLGLLRKVKHGRS